MPDTTDINNMTLRTPLGVRDLTDLDGVLDATKELYELETRGLGTLSALAGRIENLIATRESGANDHIEAEGLIQQSADLYRDIPGIRAVAALGIEPLRTKESTIVVTEADEDTGEVSERRVHLERLQVGEATGVLFSYRGTAYLYSLTSAAKVDKMGHQDWTRMLIRTIVRLRPRRLRAVSVSRYTRNLEVAGLILHAASRHVDQIWAGALELQMQGPRAPMDKLLFTMLAMAAALERDALVSRTVAGKVHAAKRNRWLPGSRSVPPGYRMFEKTLVPVPEDKPAVQALLRLLVQQPTPTAFVKKADELGLRLRVRKVSVDDATEAVDLGAGEMLGDDRGRKHVHSTSKHQKMASFMAYVPLYVTGQRVVKLPNPFPGAEEIAGVPVIVGKGGREEVHVVSTFGVPEGGWADQDLLDAALATAINYSKGHDIAVAEKLLSGLDNPDAHAKVSTAMEARAANKQKAPESVLWAGTTWRDNDWKWELRGRGARTLQLTRVPLFRPDDDQTDDDLGAGPSVDVDTPTPDPTRGPTHGPSHCKDSQ